jgi:predicted LPLAT superfamily acyltransferase
MKWTEKAERGNESLIRLIVWLARSMGRSFCRILLYPIVLYFTLADPTARRASIDFIQSVKGRRARLNEAFNHLYHFAATLLDRVYMASNDFKRFEVTIENRYLLDQGLSQGRGCVLLGSHLGSFDLMLLATRFSDPFPLSIMMRVDPRARVRRIAGIDDSQLRIIPLGEVGSFLRAYDLLRQGETVAILADRIEGHSALPAQFFGRTIRLPTAPYVLAARSGAQLLACFGIYEGANRYRIKFVETGICLEPQSRGLELQAAVDRYAFILEEQAKLYPRNWFNFYPYWDEKKVSV